MRNKAFLIAFIALFVLTACGGGTVEPVNEPTNTPMLLFSTPTLPASSTPKPTNTAALPTLTPTFAPISATLNAQINIRSAPDVNSESIGVLNFGTEVFVIARSADPEWLALSNPIEGHATGWIKASFVSLSEDLIADLRILELASTSPGQGEGSQPLLENTPEPNTATTTAEVFIRSGPGSIYPDLGTIPANTTIHLNGKNQTEKWTRIDLPNDPTGAGWIASLYIEGGNYTDLPYYDDLGNLIAGQSYPGANNSQPSVAATNTPKVSEYLPAANDQDSFEQPGAVIVFGPLDNRSFEFQNNVSSPDGDREDWIKFTPYQPEGSQVSLFAAMTCSGNGAITLSLFRENTGIWESLPLTCGVYDYIIKGNGGSAMWIRVTADGSAGDIRLVEYTLSLKVE